MKEENLNAIDFPCSYSWRAYYEETFYGRYLPPIEPPKEKPLDDRQLGGKAYVYLRVDRTSLELDSQIAVLRGELYKATQTLKELKQKSTPKRKDNIYIYKTISNKEPEESSTLE